MFGFIRKIAISILVFGSFQFGAYGSGGIHDEEVSTAARSGLVINEKKQLLDVLKMEILLLAAADPNTNPGDLRLVCKPWKGLIDSFLRGEKGKRWYKDQHPIWQKIVGVSSCGLRTDELYKTFSNARLIYRPGGCRKEVVMPFSDLKLPYRGKFDLSKCGERAKYLEMGTDPWWFFEKGEAKTRILFVTKAMLVRYVNSLKADSDELIEFKKILETLLINWNNEIAPVAILWRWGADEPKWFDHLTTQDLSSISVVDLFGNWEKSPSSWGGVPVAARCFMLIFEPRVELQSVAAAK